MLVLGHPNQHPGFFRTNRVNLLSKTMRARKVLVGIVPFNYLQKPVLPELQWKDSLQNRPIKFPELSISLTCMRVFDLNNNDNSSSYIEVDTVWLAPMGRSTFEPVSNPRTWQIIPAPEFLEMQLRLLFIRASESS